MAVIMGSLPYVPRKGQPLVDLWQALYAEMRIGRMIHERSLWKAEWLQARAKT